MNITIAVDDELVRRARIRALEQGTSVNAILREFLESYAGVHGERDARQRLLELARTCSATSGPAGRRWTRLELYEERLRPRPGRVNER
jgi:hypothetical protein